MDNKNLKDHLRHLLYVADKSIARDVPEMVKYRSELNEWLAYIDAVEVDAQRYRGLRLIVCEPDEALRERMADAIEPILPTDGDAPPFCAELDALVDNIIFAAAKVRNA